MPRLRLSLFLLVSFIEYLRDKNHASSYFNTTDAVTRFGRNYLTYSARSPAAQKATRGCESLFGSIDAISVFGLDILNANDNILIRSLDSVPVKLHKL